MVNRGIYLVLISHVLSFIVWLRDNEISAYKRTCILTIYPSKVCKYSFSFIFGHLPESKNIFSPNEYGTLVNHQQEERIASLVEIKVLNDPNDYRENHWDYQ
jgi:hypothetical protein